MPVSQKLISLLKKNKTKYELLKHKTVYTAFDKAATLRVKASLIGKTLVLKTDKDLVVALVPGNKNLDKNKFKKAVGDWRKKQGGKTIKSLDFVSEKLMKNKFKGVKAGAIPPFGGLWGLPTFVDRGLMRSSKIIVSAGDYSCSIKMNPAAFKKAIPDLAIGNFSKKK